MLQEAVKIKTHVDTIRAVKKAKEMMDASQESATSSDKEVSNTTEPKE